MIKIGPKVFGVTVKEATVDGFKKIKVRNGITISEKITHNNSSEYEKIRYAKDGSIFSKTKYKGRFLPTLMECTFYRKGEKYQTTQYLKNISKKTVFHNDGSTTVTTKNIDSLKPHTVECFNAQGEQFFFMPVSKK